MQLSYTLSSSPVFVLLFIRVGFFIFFTSIIVDLHTKLINIAALLCCDQLLIFPITLLFQFGLEFLLVQVLLVSDLI